MRERCKRMSERRSKWPSALRVDFLVILPNVRVVRQHLQLILLAKCFTPLQYDTFFKQLGCISHSLIAPKKVSPLTQRNSRKVSITQSRDENLAHAYQHYNISFCKGFFPRHDFSDFDNTQLSQKFMITLIKHLSLLYTFFLAQAFYISLKNLQLTFFGAPVT